MWSFGELLKHTTSKVIKVISERAWSHVRCSVGVTKEFLFRVVVDSDLFSLLFNTVLNALTGDIRKKFLLKVVTCWRHFRCGAYLVGILEWNPQMRNLTTARCLMNRQKSCNKTYKQMVCSKLTNRCWKWQVSDIWRATSEGEGGFSSVFNEHVSTAWLEVLRSFHCRKISAETEFEHMSW